MGDGESCLAQILKPQTMARHRLRTSACRTIPINNWHLWYLQTAPIHALPPSGWRSNCAEYVLLLPQLSCPAMGRPWHSKLPTIGLSRFTIVHPPRSNQPDHGFCCSCKPFGDDPSGHTSHLIAPIPDRHFRPA